MSIPQKFPWRPDDLRARARDNLASARYLVQASQPQFVASGAARLYYAVLHGVLARLCEANALPFASLGIGEIRGIPHVEHGKVIRNLEKAGLDGDERSLYLTIKDLRVIADYTTQEIPWSTLERSVRNARLLETRLKIGRSL